MKAVNPLPKEAYEKMLGRTLTDEELSQVHHIVVGYFRVLVEMDQQRKMYINDKE